MGKNWVNKELDVKLISLVKAHPLIYNPKTPQYEDFDSREVVWQRIGDILNRPANICKSRWVNIRDSMRKRYRMMREGRTFSCKYKYESEMSFILPFFSGIDSTTNEHNFEEAQFLLAVTESNQHYETAEHFIDKDIKPIYEEYVSKEFSTTDPIDTFLLSVGATLRKLSPYYCKQAKSKIFQIVQDYELKQIMGKSVPGTSGECSSSS